jgi:hypothetical protein
MPRPSKNNAEYFSHDKHMRKDEKVFALKNKFGAHLGYCLWAYTLEVLTDEDEFELNMSEMRFELLAGEYQVDVELLKEAFSYMVKIELLSTDGQGTYWSESLKRRLQPVLDKRERARKAAAEKKEEDSFLSQKPGKKPLDKRKSAGGDEGGAPKKPPREALNGSEKSGKNGFLPQEEGFSGVSVTEIPQSKVKESKEKENKFFLLHPRARDGGLFGFAEVDDFLQKTMSSQLQDLKQRFGEENYREWLPLFEQRNEKKQWANAADLFDNLSKTFLLFQRKGVGNYLGEQHHRSPRGRPDDRESSGRGGGRSSEYITHNGVTFKAKLTSDEIDDEINFHSDRRKARIAWMREQGFM